MKTFIIAALAFSLYSCSASSASPQSGTTTSYEEAKMTIGENEQQNPMQFLNAKGLYHTNLIGQWVYEGIIRSTATVTTYKDVHLRFNFYTKTRTLLGSIDRTVIEFFQPSGTQNFKFKFAAPDGTELMDCEMVDAAVAN